MGLIFPCSSINNHQLVYIGGLVVEGTSDTPIDSAHSDSRNQQKSSYVLCTGFIATAGNIDYIGSTYRQTAPMTVMRND